MSALDLQATERLVAAAIKRDGIVLDRGFKSHWQLRSALDDPDPKNGRPGDVDGFVTSTGRFVDRMEAREVGIAAGQINSTWRGAHRDLLSSDINW
jgi:hypothetical protein